MTITINEQEYQRDGCCILRSLLTADEVAALKALMTDPDGIRKWAFTGTTKMSSFQAPGDDVLGRVARSRKLHEAANAALGGTPNLHHIQATFKEPHSVYEFAWHQDYGYQYNSMILLPTMCTIFIAVDPCHPKNGGLEVVVGSHLCGRLDHVPRGPKTRQLTVDPQRMEALLSDPRFSTRKLSLEPGDAVLFHCNLVHRSLPNDSDSPRYALNIALNRVDNVAPGGLRVYSLVEDADVLAGGAAFLPDSWGAVAIPRDVHERMEAVRDKGPGAQEVFESPDEVVAGAVRYKAMALKLSLKEEGQAGDPSHRLVATCPPTD